ncbi:aminotransferase class I/II-fold pyridoxal phosphate-dependent enzyme [Alteromonas lipotrueiana]|uniref:aminotransferase class I/II-fold pyridoxal phosphate-dependent enzyme n=1 Tax=Alteromonas lipotrueiana TaxID=2803815 RepID=UPI001C450553|nr:aminotransferase class I/II-fold pyridoxal phosphate-dependent enzyme [Alteromonas lipotrueiana]
MPRPVSQAITKYLHSKQVGYQNVDICSAVISWLKQQGVPACDSWIVPIASVVNSLWRCIDIFSEPGDRIALFSPVYGPFFNSITEQQRELVELNWQYNGQTYRPDIANLPTDVSIILICQPNNPTGSVWNYDELEALARHCKQHNIVLISDEVHRDFGFDTQVNSVLNLPTELLERCIMLGSPSKSFNLAGIGPAAYIITANSGIKHRLAKDVERHHQQPSPLASIVTNAACSMCEDWFDAVKQAIAANRHIVSTSNLSEPFSLYLGPATYFAWLDASRLGDNAKYLMLNHYKLALGDGTQFGKPGYFRLNLATHPEVVVEVLKRLNFTCKDVDTHTLNGK